jgi:hypothetical protein
VCGAKHMKLNLFIPHLLQHPEESIKCSVCLIPVKPNCMAKHLMIHSINVYQCLYCEFGTNIQKTMKNHIVEAHPSCRVFCYIRTKRSEIVSIFQFIMYITSCNSFWHSQPHNHKNSLNSI